MSEIVPEGAPAESVELPPEQEVGWSGPSPEEWQATQERLQQFEQALTPQQPSYEQQGPPIPDPFSETYSQDLQQFVQAQLEPYAQFQQQLQMQEAEERGMEILNQHASSLGEFDREMAWARANQLVAQYGSDARAAERALEQAAKDTREYEKRVGEAYHQQQIEQIQTIAGAPRGIPAQVNGAQTVTAGGYGNVPGAVERRFFGG
jgi:hypothetical protein